MKTRATILVFHFSSQVESPEIAQIISINKFRDIYKYGFQLIDYMYNPKTVTVIVPFLPTGLALCMHPNDKRRELCIRSKLES